MFDERKGQGATEYLLILAAVLVIAASAVYFVTQTGGYPAVGAVATVQNDNEIHINVQTGSIPAEEWAVDFDPDDEISETDKINEEDGVGQEALEAPGVHVADYDPNSDGTQSITVELSHVDTGHVYFSTTVTVG